MAVHVISATDDDLGHRTRRPQPRNVSHRFRRQGHFWTRRGFRLLLAINVAVLLALALRSVIGPRNDVAHRPRPHAVSAIAHVVAAPPVLSVPPVGPAPVFRVQVASFLDHRNAARMIEQLRGEGLPAETRLVEGHQVRYRVLATPGEGESDEELLARLSVLGFSAEVVNGGIAVMGFVPAEDADETASRLEDEGISVRAQDESRTVSYHVVRVGAYRTAEAAERARVALAARGLAGLVVRERTDGRESE
jgi:cell division protein FtsN